jgi:isopenicillin N synthase-like dioxygenase
MAFLYCVSRIHTIFAQLYLDGAWHPVRAPANSYIVNLGDLMQRWTNDTWRSTLHRVVPPPPDVSGSTRRQSMAFFHNINPYV